MNLPPLNHDEDIKQFEAHSEKKEINFTGCTHKDIQFNKEKHELRCKCGVAFTGERLGELYSALTKK